MKMLATILLLCPSTLLVASDKEEPALSYTLRLDKETIRLVPGKEIQIKGRFDNPTATLVPDTERLFTHGQVTFKYPANFAFEADFDTKDVKIWTLDGNSCVIMVHQYESAEMAPKEFAAQLKKMYGAGTRIESRLFSLNGQKYSGVRIHATIASQKLIQDVLALPAKKGSRLLILGRRPHRSPETCPRDEPLERGHQDEG